MNSATPVPVSSSRLSSKILGKGIGIAAVAYVLLAGYLLLKAPETKELREGKLASETVAIVWEEGVEKGAEETHAAPAEGEPHAITPDVESAQHPEIAEAEKHEKAQVAPEEPSPAAALTLERAPFEGLFEDTAEGRIPKIAEDGTTPFNAYKRPFTSPANAKIISVALMDAGISEDTTAQAVNELPADISLIVTPYAVRADHWLDEARAKGFETWLSLPVETDLYPFNDPGPQTLLLNASERLNLNKLYWTLSRGSGYAGLVTDADASFLRSPEDARPVLNEIYTRGLGFIDGSAAPAETAVKLAQGLKAPYATVDVWIDVPSSPEHIAASFRQLEVLAEGRGNSMGFIHATPQGLKTLKAWIETLPAKGYVLAPLSAQAGDFAQ